MATEKQISNLVINKVESQDIYDYLSSNNLLNEDELYLVKSDEGNNSSDRMWFGTCTTAAATAAKSVTTTTGDFLLQQGSTVFVQFNTAITSTSTTLNVDNTGAITVQTSATNALTANQVAPKAVVGFVYDGTVFRMLDGAIATTTYYGVTKLSSAINSTSTATAATSSAVKQAYDLAAAALPLRGGTMEGDLTLLDDPTNDQHAVTKKYVDHYVTSLTEQVQAIVAVLKKHGMTVDIGGNVTPAE